MREAKGKIQPKAKAGPISAPVDTEKLLADKSESVLKKYQDLLKKSLKPINDLLTQKKLTKTYPQLYSLISKSLGIPSHSYDYVIESVVSYTDFYSELLREGWLDRVKKGWEKTKTYAQKTLDPTLRNSEKLNQQFSNIEGLKSKFTQEIASIYNIQDKDAKALETSVRNRVPSTKVQEFYAALDELIQRFQEEHTAVQKSKGLVKDPEVNKKSWTEEEQNKNYKIAFDRVGEIASRFEDGLRKVAQTIPDDRRYRDLKSFVNRLTLDRKSKKFIFEAVDKNQDERIKKELWQVSQRALFSLMIVVRNLAKEWAGQSIHSKDFIALLRDMFQHKFPNLTPAQNGDLYREINRLHTQLSIIIRALDKGKNVNDFDDIIKKSRFASPSRKPSARNPSTTPRSRTKTSTSTSAPPTSPTTTTTKP
jgi:hypothetical protein